MRIDRFLAVAAIVGFALSTTPLDVAVAQAAVTNKPVDAPRAGDKSLETIVRTDDRYSHDGLFQPVRGWAYWNYLEKPLLEQNPNLWPDTEPSYYIARLAIPTGATLTLHFQYPRARYFGVSLYKLVKNSYVPIDDLDGPKLKPDSGSVNPYVVGANRLATNRSFTLDIVGRDAPKGSGNSRTLYAGSGGGIINLVSRVYVSDACCDGLGWGPALAASAGNGPTYEGRLANGKRLPAAQVVAQWAKPENKLSPAPMTADQWYAMVDKTGQPATAPAKPDSVWEKFWNIKYSVVGEFAPAIRATTQYGGVANAGANPATTYLEIFLSRKFGALYVFRAKMPQFPDTYNNLAVEPATPQAQYWSVVTAASIVSGEDWDGLFDMQVPAGKDGYYTIVVSKPEDRPSNATPENGITWLNWGPGEGLTDPRNRTDWSMLIMRFIQTDPNWSNDPGKITKPGMEASVLGPYYPRGYYTDKATFEAQGPKPYSSLQGASR
jgi:hypothetical protein